jgi:hypothetical protein
MLLQIEVTSIQFLNSFSLTVFLFLLLGGFCRSGFFIYATKLVSLFCRKLLFDLIVPQKGFFHPPNQSFWLTNSCTNLVVNGKEMFISVD